MSSRKMRRKYQVLCSLPTDTTSGFQADVWKTVTQTGPLEGPYPLYYPSAVSHWSVCCLKCPPLCVFGLYYLAPLEVTVCGVSSSPELPGDANGSGHSAELPQAPVSRPAGSLWPCCEPRWATVQGHVPEELRDSEEASECNTRSASPVNYRST